MVKRRRAQVNVKVNAKCTNVGGNGGMFDIIYHVVWENVCRPFHRSTLFPSRFVSSSRRLMYNRFL